MIAFLTAPFIQPRVVHCRITNPPLALLSSLSDSEIGSQFSAAEKSAAMKLQQRLEFSDAEVVKLLIKGSDLLDYDVDKSIVPKLDWLQASFGLTTTELKRMVQSSPFLLKLSLEATIQPRVLQLQEIFGLNSQELRQVLVRCPILLTLSMEANIIPTRDCLVRLIGLSDAEMRRVVVSFPQIITLNAEQNAAPTLRGVRALLDITDDDNEPLRMLVVSYPQILALRLDDNMVPKVDFLAEALGLSTAQLRDCVLRSPTILGTSLERSLRPNVQAWKDALPEDVELGDVIMGGSGLRFLASSYEKRTKPRLALAAQNGVPSQMLIKKMRLTDSKFEEWLSHTSESLRASREEEASRV